MPASGRAPGGVGVAFAQVLELGEYHLDLEGHGGSLWGSVPFASVSCPWCELNSGVMASQWRMWQLTLFLAKPVSNVVCPSATALLRASAVS